MFIALDSVALQLSLRPAGGRGFGLAACPALGLLVTSCKDNTLVLFELPNSVRADTPPAGLAHVCTLGGADSPAPMQFLFCDEMLCPSGSLAFTGPPTSRLLLVTDAGHDAVHIIDVVARAHVGYLAAPGYLTHPRGVAARGSLAAVSSWKGLGGDALDLFEGSGCSWSPVRMLCAGWCDPERADGLLRMPSGLRFTSDGTGLAVADYCNDRVSLFRVSDGSFVRHLATGLAGPSDVEECEGGWLVACHCSHTVEFVGGSVGGILDGDVELKVPSALALVPGLGLVVRDNRVHVFATPDVIAMAAMSACRVAWMVGVVRGLARRGARGDSVT
jgi:hypothetical protein